MAGVANFAACSGVSQNTFPTSPGRETLTEQKSITSELQMPSTSGVPATFAAGYFKNNITIWNKENQPIGKLLGGGFPHTDTSGFVYAYEADYNTVRVFAPPYTGTPVRIRFGSESIHSLAVDEKDGTFAVLAQVPSDGHGRFHFFRRGEVKPCNVVDGPPSFFLNAGSAFDAEGTLFFTATVASNDNSVVGSVAGGCSAIAAELYTFTTDISPEVLIAFDKNDNLVVQNYHRDTPLAIYTFAHPKNGVFGKPVSETIPRQYNGIYPRFLSMASDGNHMWAGFLGTTLGYYNYPEGGKPVLLLRALQGINGIATLPPLVP